MPRVATVEELMDYLDLQDAERIPGELFVNILESAEALAEAYAGRRFSPDPVLDASGADTNPPVVKTIQTRSSSVRLPDLRVTTSATLDGSAIVDGQDYYTDATDGEPATRMKLTNWTDLSSFTSQTYRTLVITGRWGFNPCPKEIKDAVLTLAARRWRERDAAYADTVQYPDGGAVSYYRQLPAMVKTALDLYRIPNIALVNA